MTDNFYLALFITLLAGLSTMIGSTIAFFFKTTQRRFLSFSLGLSAGVMVYISFAEILQKSLIILQKYHTPLEAEVLNVVSFFSGIFVMLIIDRMIPDYENPHEIHLQEEIQTTKSQPAYSYSDLKKLKRTGIFMALAVGIHNFPEGLVTFLSVLNEPHTGFFIAFAIAVHNIPEGISISVPIYYATGNKKKAFFYSSLSGLSEPIGALIGYMLLFPILSEDILGLLFAGVAGVMIYISIDELLPAAHKYGEHHISIYGFIVGMLVMAFSLLLFLAP